jgi:hypothetical protein
MQGFAPSMISSIVAATDSRIGVYAVSIQSGDRRAVLKTPAAIRLILRP